MNEFIDRKEELKTLNDEYKRNDSSFVVVYGRRRVGKTRLITHFIKDKPSLYFLATEESDVENRNNFKNAVGEYLNNDLLLNSNNISWELIFKELIKDNKKMILVIDEFQYLGKSNKAFPSIMMKIWDTLLKDSKIMLIICGSLISMMKDQVLNYNAPLYGRRTAQINLKQVKFEYYKDFNKDLTINEQILYYALTGGVPKYIELFNNKANIYKAIEENVLNVNSFLYAEPEFLLSKEVSEIGSYFSILKTIANGNHKIGNIAAALNVSQSSLTAYLNTLIELELVERIVPITENNSSKSKKGLYILKDNFISFWFKFVYPNRYLIEQGQSEYVLDKIKKNYIDNHVSYIYEDICRQDLYSFKQSFNKVGKWWGDKDVEIDIVGLNDNSKDIIFGECKYSSKPKGLDVLNKLIDKSKHVKWNDDARNNYYIIYSKSGFKDELVSYSNKHKEVILKTL